MNLSTGDLKAVWTELFNNLQVTRKKQLELWNELERRYNGKYRYYHNLNHLESMLGEFNKHADSIENKEVLLISIFYHDLIYNPLRKDNELKSAERMKYLLASLGISNQLINDSFRQIIQTQTHQISSESKPDDLYLLDFDLEILSRDWEAYKTYAQQIRKEYWMYPTLLYRKGRKKAMLHFLERDTIYYTNQYRSTSEASARRNIKREIEKLLVKINL